MDRTKLTAFLLLVASFGAILLTCFMAAGPFLLSGPQFPTGDVPPGCLAVAMLFIFGSISAIPGIAGLVTWLRTVRKRDRERAREAAFWPNQEATLQIFFDRLALALLSGPGEDRLSGLHPGAEHFGPERRLRWRRFLVATGAPGELFLTADVREPAAPAMVSARGLRILAFVLLLFGAFCFAWAMLTAFVQIATQGNRALGVEVAPLQGAFLGAGGCLIPGITTLAGAVGLVSLLRRERRRGAQEEEWQERAREVLLDGCMRRLERLLGGGPEAQPPMAEMARTLARATVFDALAELDGDRKGRLLLALHGRRLTTSLQLQGADLREAKLANADLSGAALAGADLSRAVLAGARLERADLRSCRLWSADLRGAFVAYADLRQGDLRDAWLQRCDFRNADLRNADLRGAHFWQTSLTDADLQGSFGSPGQPPPPAPLPGGFLPPAPGEGQEGRS